MNKPKFTSALLLAVFLCSFIFSGCFGGEAVSSTSQLVPVISGGDSPDSGAEIALIVTKTQRDHPNSLELWDEIRRFAAEQGLSCGSYQTEDDENSASATLDLAITGGAKLIITAGASLSPMVKTGQITYPDIQFVIFESDPSLVPMQNTVKISYPYEQAGWMAGYAAVWDDALKLVYQNSSMPQARLYALGFLMGAEQAAEERHLQPGSIMVLPIEPEASSSQSSSLSLPQPYAVSQESQPSQDISGSSAEAVTSQNLQDGNEDAAQVFALMEFAQGDYTILFANDIDYQEHMLKIAKEAGMRVIGLDKAAKEYEDVLLTSISFTPGKFMESLLAEWKAGQFPGGKEIQAGPAEGGFALSMDSHGFERFSQKRYEMTIEKFSEGSVADELAQAAKLVKAGTSPEQAAAMQYLVYYDKSGEKQAGSESIPPPASDSISGVS